MSRRPQANSALAAMDGYHSPQLEVDIRLNTNEAPWPPPPGFAEVVARAIERLAWNRYPDRGAAGLRGALGRRYGHPAEMVFAANGSNEVLQTLLIAYGGVGRSAAVFEPTYALHSHIASMLGTEMIVGERQHDFTIGEAEVDRVMAMEPDVVFLCSPNNPTGMVEPPGLVSRVLASCSEIGALLVVDEAYGQFSDWSALELMGPETPLLVTRTYSKTWAMAAARLGYGIAPSWIVEELEKAVLPYHLDSFKQVAGNAALEFERDMQERVSALVEQRELVAAGLAGLPVEVWPSGSNFILFRPIGRSGEQVWRGLVERSILVRNCGSWPRLQDCLRVTIGTDDENRAFLDVLAEILEQ